jgi:hypothetical protein
MLAYCARAWEIFKTVRREKSAYVRPIDSTNRSEREGKFSRILVPRDGNDFMGGEAMNS